MLLDKSTHHYINKQRLETMKKDAVLVNAARGPVIDEVGGCRTLRFACWFAFAPSDNSADDADGLVGRVLFGLRAPCLRLSAGFSSCE